MGDNQLLTELPGPTTLRRKALSGPGGKHGHDRQKHVFLALVRSGGHLGGAETVDQTFLKWKIKNRHRGAVLLLRFSQ